MALDDEEYEEQKKVCDENDDDEQNDNNGECILGLLKVERQNDRKILFSLKVLDDSEYNEL